MINQKTKKDVTVEINKKKKNSARCCQAHVGDPHDIEHEKGHCCDEHEGGENKHEDDRCCRNHEGDPHDIECEKSRCCDSHTKTEEEQPEPEPSKEEEELNVKYLRLMADFQNFRRRTEKERGDIYAYANEAFAVDCLEVLDNFERALASAPENDKFAEGMALICKQFVDVLAKNKVLEIEAEGKPFDHNLHNAVLKQPAEGVESDVVTQVLQKGYTLNGKVIRPSAVIVAE
ncbi:MAG TPA: nucleotide exchange factor GrpE [Bacillota bacterium]|nr:nucleotide exchange factor GrpE [Bacillota bacterium]HQC36235.1 nucleotide exchange factor GrpE [Bacillota bacterium]